MRAVASRLCPSEAAGEHRLPLLVSTKCLHVIDPLVSLERLTMFKNCL